MYKGAEKKLQEVEHSSKQAVGKLLYSLLEACATMTLKNTKVYWSMRQKLLLGF